MYDIPRIMFKVGRFLNYQGKYSLKKQAMLTSLILLFSEHKSLSVSEVFNFSHSNFKQNINPNNFIELIEIINLKIEPKINIYSKNDDVYFETSGDLISSINHFNFGNLANYERDKYPLFDFRENTELYLHSIESHSEKREAMLTALITLAKENKLVTYKNVLFFAEEYFDQTLGKTPFNSLILDLNKYTKSNIKILKQGKKTVYSELKGIEDKINEYKLPDVDKMVIREKEPLDTSLFRTNVKGEFEISALLKHFMGEYQLKVEDGRVKSPRETIHEIVFDDVYNLFVNHNIYTDKRASMFTSLVVLLKSHPVVDLEMIRDHASSKLYGSLKSAQFIKLLNTFNRFSPSAIKVINKTKYSCNNLEGLNNFIESHRSKAIKLTDIINLLENTFIEDDENEKINELIARKDSLHEVGTKLLANIVKNYIKQKTILIAASRLNLQIINDGIEIETEMEKLYLIDFALNDLYFKITANDLKKYKNVDRKYLNTSTNLIERFKILKEVNNQEKILIDQWLSSKLSLFEIVEINPPLLKVRDLLNSKTNALELVIDRNLSQSVDLNTIWGFRLTKFEKLGSTSGISFLFPPEHKNKLLKQWKKLNKKLKRKRKSQLLFVYLFEAQRKFGLNIESELFLERLSNE